MPVSCCTIALKLEVSAERTAMGALLLARLRLLLTLVIPAPADAWEDKAMEAVLGEESVLLASLLEASSGFNAALRDKFEFSQRPIRTSWRCGSLSVVWV